MNRPLHHAALAVGLAVIGWVGLGYLGNNPLALAITAVVLAFYGMGAWELRGFQRDSTQLAGALDRLAAPPPGLEPWLATLPAPLRPAVRLRVQGERVGLPGPTLTPFLAGLLVLLGMLGTFLGMVVTLNGTGLALETATDLASIRASVSAPVKGLGVAFGTSIAGVAASAMLGLMSALCRAERQQLAQRLDAAVATTLRSHSLIHQREQAQALMQRQADALPMLVDRLQAMAAAMEAQTHALGRQLIDQQAEFHRRTEAAFTTLASAVDHSLRQSLADAARQAGEAMRPAVEAAMAGVAREASDVQQRLTDTVNHQLDHLARGFEVSTQRTAQLWTDALAQQQRSGDALVRHTEQALDRASASFEQRAARLLDGVAEAHATLQRAVASQDQQRLETFTLALHDSARQLQAQSHAAGEQALDQHQRLAAQLAQSVTALSEQAEAQSRRTIAEVARLIDTAEQAPRLAAAVMTEMRQALSDSLARDNEALDERRRTLQTLSTLLDAVNHASTEQRGAIDALVASSADLLDRVGRRFAEDTQGAANQLTQVVHQATSSTIEVASLGEAFGHAIHQFGQSSDALAAQLQGIQQALNHTLTRSDDQLAYYVAQARELVDLTVMSQKQVVDELQRLAATPRESSIA